MSISSRSRDRVGSAPNSRPRPDHPRAGRGVGGFTLVELLVVIGIIALLVSILLPALSKARESANQAACASNQRQIMMAFIMFANEHDQRLPGNWWDYNDPNVEHRSWLIDAYQPIDTAPQAGTLWPYLKNDRVYLCPSYAQSITNVGAGSNGRFDYASFIVFSGAKLTRMKMDAKFNYPDGRIANDVYTPVVCEEEPAGGINGGNMEGGHCNSDRLGHYHRGGANYATIDASVHWFKEPKECSSWNWFSKAPSGNFKTLGDVPIPGWAWWDKQ